jgi:radical SAM protein with 4Fe4S-binding SPASM domain
MKPVNIFQNRFLTKDPFFLILYVTARCNARCKMCYYWDNIVEWRSRSHLELDEIEKITNNINSLQQLTISGGEPFLRQELAEICTLFRKNCNVQFITIPTNGILTGKTELIMKEALSKNPDVHFRIGLSMPEMGEELDELYGVKNSFKQHQETFQMLKSLRRTYSNLNIDVGIVYNKYNADRTREIIDYVIENMDGCNPIVSVVRGKPRLEESKDISISELQHIYEHVKESIPKLNNRPCGDFMNLMRDMVHEITVETLRDQKMVVPCEAGKKLMVIYDNGDLYPCELLEENLGNVRDFDYDIHRILELQNSKNVVKKIVDEKCFCTWECANNNNIIFSPSFTADLFSRYVKYKMGMYPPKDKTSIPINHEHTEEVEENKISEPVA